MAEQEQPGDSQWPDEDEWLDDEDQPDDYVTDLSWPAAPVPEPARPGPVIGPGTRLRRVLGPLAVAVLAAAAGAGLVLAFTGSSGGPSAAASSGKSPRYLAPGGQAGPASPRQGSGVLPGGTSSLFLVGTVTAVSSTSITIAGAGPALTAAVTSSTRVSGRVASISGIKVGDHVSALISQNGGRATATAIAYPPEQLGGGGVP